MGYRVDNWSAEVGPPKVIQWSGVITASDGKEYPTGSIVLSEVVPVDADGNPINDYTPEARAALQAADLSDPQAVIAIVRLDAKRAADEREAGIAAAVQPEAPAPLVG